VNNSIKSAQLDRIIIIIISLLSHNNHPAIKLLADNAEAARITVIIRRVRAAINSRSANQ
jgi:hypothetical protein